MITITNNNIYRNDFSLSDISSLEHAEIISPNIITNYLSDYVELGESVTFKRLFEIISYNVDKFNQIFFSTLGGYKLEPFLQEIENNPTEKIESDYLEIYWYSDKYDNEISILTSLHGLSNKEDDDNSYALDFVSLNNLKNCIVKINKEVSIIEYTNEEIKTIELGEKTPTLFELFNAILYEITFHGGPQDKQERFESLEESVKEIDLENSKTYSLEEMMDEFYAKDKYLVKYEELRDRVDEKRILNEKNLDKLKNCLLEKLKIYSLIERNDDNLSQFYKKLTNIEFDMQLLYGEVEDISYHKFWETPKCTCPKIDNIEIYPSKTPFFDKKCPIHKK